MSTERNFFNDNEPFKGVVLRGVSDEMFGIRLLHPNALFTRDLAEVDEFNAVADWRMIAKNYNLPLLIEQETGDIVEINQRLGALNVYQPAARRRGMWSLYNRRPRHVSRRKQAAHQQACGQNKPSIAV
jgi:hypothetical protein